MNTVAIVGRPNVGKSTLFNRICEKRISIVEDTPGVTRDRIYGTAEWAGYDFTVIDTGGIDIKEKSEMQEHITLQAKIAIDIADVVVFVVDGKEGLTQGDHDACDILRKTKKPVLLVVNKLDNDKMEQEAYDFYNLGFSNLFFVSSIQGRGIGDLLDEIVGFLKKDIKKEEIDSSNLKIAVVGKPNAGKSSLINKLLGENRLVVSDIAGTTRDSIDTTIKFYGKFYTLIDTAGIRKKNKVEEETLELYSILRSFDAIRRSDIVFLVVDSAEKVTDQDLKIASYIHAQGKPSVIVMNKWDAIEKDSHTIEKYNEMLSFEFAFMKYFKAVYISAKTGTRVNELLPLATEIYEKAQKRITTGTLNEILHEAFRLNPPPNVKGITLKLLYATQASVNPPNFVMFVNNATSVQNSYLRYIENFIRKSIDFEGVPIKITLKSRSDKDEA